MNKPDRPWASRAFPALARTCLKWADARLSPSGPVWRWPGWSGVGRAGPYTSWEAAPLPPPPRGRPRWCRTGSDSPRADQTPVPWNRRWQCPASGVRNRPEAPRWSCRATKSGRCCPCSRCPRLLSRPSGRRGCSAYLGTRSPEVWAQQTWTTE